MRRKIIRGIQRATVVVNAATAATKAATVAHNAGLWSVLRSTTHRWRVSLHDAGKAVALALISGLCQAGLMLAQYAQAYIVPTLQNSKTWQDVALAMAVGAGCSFLISLVTGGKAPPRTLPPVPLSPVPHRNPPPPVPEGQDPKFPKW